MNPGVLTTDDLRTLLGLDKPSAIARRLRAQGIVVFWGKDGPWTTLALINAAGGMVDVAPASRPYEASELL